MYYAPSVGDDPFDPRNPCDPSRRREAELEHLDLDQFRVPNVFAVVQNRDDDGRD